jgi:hypothetical protein
MPIPWLLIVLLIEKPRAADKLNRAPKSCSANARFASNFVVTTPIWPKIESPLPSLIELGGWQEFHDCGLWQRSCGLHRH